MVEDSLRLRRDSTEGNDFPRGDGEQSGVTGRRDGQFISSSLREGQVKTMTDHRLDRIHADDLVDHMVSEAETDAARRDIENVRRGACSVCEQVGSHEDECPEGYAPLQSNVRVEE